MSNRKYQKGYRLEREVKIDMEAKGWVAIRAAGSKGKSKIDIVAIKENTIRGIQCKANGKILLEERRILIENYHKHNILPLLASKERIGKRVRIKYTLLL